MKLKHNIGIVIVLLCVILGGCNQSKTNKNYISKIKSGNKNDYVFKYLDIGKEQMDNIVCLQDDNIIYSTYENNDSSLGFYKYNLTNNKKYALGNIKNPYIDSGDIAFNEEEIYFYSNSIINDVDGNSWLENSLYKIDIKDNFLEKLAEDTVDQTLVYLNSINNKIISFKGKVDGKNSITYLDVFDNTKIGDEKFDILISKKFDMETQNGEIIYNFAQNNEKLYVLIYENSDQGASWKIELYNICGEKIGNIEVDTKTIELLNEDRVAKFEVFDKYAFIRTFSGGGVLLNISSNVTKPKLLREGDLDIAIALERKEHTYTILYSRDTGDVWKLDTSKDRMVTVNLPHDTIKYVYIDSNNKIMLAVDNIIYGDIDGFSVSEENILLE